MSEQQKKKNLVFLTGFMGSGKSTIGPIIANTLGYGFVDLDRMIEHREGRKIGLIFKEDGESRFRELERSVVREYIHHSREVISLGGGTIVHDPTLALVREHGILVYLRMSSETILRRLKSKADRPMLRDEKGDLMGIEQLRLHVQKLIDQRTPYYEQADVLINTDNQRIGLTVDELVRRLRPLVEST
jgi:shikimate kinase